MLSPTCRAATPSSKVGRSVKTVGGMENIADVEPNLSTVDERLEITGEPSSVLPPASLLDSPNRTRLRHCRPRVSAQIDHGPMSTRMPRTGEEAFVCRRSSKFGSRAEGVRIGRENTASDYVVAPDDFRIELVEVQPAGAGDRATISTISWREPAAVQAELVHRAS